MHLILSLCQNLFKPRKLLTKISLEFRHFPIKTLKKLNLLLDQVADKKIIGWWNSTKTFQVSARESLWIFFSLYLENILEHAKGDDVKVSKFCENARKYFCFYPLPCLWYIFIKHMLEILLCYLTYSGRLWRNSINKKQSTVSDVKSLKTVALCFDLSKFLRIKLIKHDDLN